MYVFECVQEEENTLLLGNSKSNKDEVVALLRRLKVQYSSICFVFLSLLLFRVFLGCQSNLTDGQVRDVESVDQDNNNARNKMVGPQCYRLKIEDIDIQLLARNIMNKATSMVDASDDNALGNLNVKHCYVFLLFIFCYSLKLLMRTFSQRKNPVVSLETKFGEMQATMQKCIELQRDLVQRLGQ